MGALPLLSVLLKGCSHCASCTNQPNYPFQAANELKAFTAHASSPPRGRGSPSRDALGWKAGTALREMGSRLQGTERVPQTPTGARLGTDKRGICCTIPLRS